MSAATIVRRLERMRHQVERAAEHAPQPPPLVWHGPITLATHRRRERMLAAYAPLLEHALKPVLYYDQIANADVMRGSTTTVTYEIADEAQNLRMPT